MAQNIYDHPDFFAGYSQLPRSIGGLDAANEWPSLRAMLPDMAGLDVVDLGCGFGWFCRWARQAGAASVLGIDLSARMLERATAETTDQAVIYRQEDLAALDLPQAAFDLAYSSLALHYIEDAARLFATIHQALRPGGAFVFSTEHPIYMAPTRPGWSVDSTGRTVWPVDSYLVEGPRSTDWLAPGVIKYHRTIGTTVTSLLQAGFTLTGLEEFCPTDQQMTQSPAMAHERERPMFLVMKASK
jgi:SAM-dependent methyltransferase